MSYCVNCGSPIPDGWRTCSMCYGDIAHGRDGYYEQWAREQIQQMEQEDTDNPAIRERVEQKGER